LSRVAGFSSGGGSRRMRDGLGATGFSPMLALGGPLGGFQCLVTDAG